MSAVDVARRLAGSRLLRALVTVLLLVVVLRGVEWNVITERVRTGSPGYGLLAVLAVMAALAVGAMRWDVLLRLTGVELSRSALLRIYAVSSFANAFLPTSVGGDVARPLMVARRGPVLIRAITTVVFERLIALVALVALAWAGVALAPGEVAAGATVTLAVVTAGIAIVFAAVVLRPSAVRRLAAAVLPARLMSHGREALTALRAMLDARWQLGVIALQSVAFQALVTIQLVLLGAMIGVDLSFGLAAVALALVTLATLIPISIGGFGLREGGYVVVLAGGGIGHTDAVLISLLTVVALFIATLPGAVALVRNGFTAAIPGPSA